MSFHVLSWLMGTGRGDAFVSDTVLLTEAGPEVLTGAGADRIRPRTARAAPSATSQ